jgi:hypothetical protein
VIIHAGADKADDGGVQGTYAIWSHASNVDPATGGYAVPGTGALERLLRLWFAYLPEILPVARALEAAAINGDEGGVAWRDRMGDLRELFAAAVARVDGGGRLAEGWTVPAATDWVWARAQPSTFQHLVGDRAWPPGDYTERAVRSVLSEVVSPPG